MPISGLVIGLSNQPDQVALTHRALTRDPRLTVGAGRDRRLPVVTETSSPEEDRALQRWITALPAVTSLDIAFIGFDATPPGGAQEL